MPEYKGKQYPYTAEGIAQLERDKRRDAQRPGSGVTFPDGTYSPDADPGSVTVSQASNRDDMPQWGDKILSPEQFDRLQKINQRIDELRPDPERPLIQPYSGQPSTFDEGQVSPSGLTSIGPTTNRIGDMLGEMVGDSSRSFGDGVIRKEDTPTPAILQKLNVAPRQKAAKVMEGGGAVRGFQNTLFDDLPLEELAGSPFSFWDRTQASFLRGDQRNRFLQRQLPEGWTLSPDGQSATDTEGSVHPVDPGSRFVDDRLGDIADIVGDIPEMGLSTFGGAAGFGAGTLATGNPIGGLAMAMPMAATGSAAGDAIRQGIGSYIEPAPFDYESVGSMGQIGGLAEAAGPVISNAASALSQFGPAGKVGQAMLGPFAIAASRWFGKAPRGIRQGQMIEEGSGQLVPRGYSPEGAVTGGAWNTEAYEILSDGIPREGRLKSKFEIGSGGKRRVTTAGSFIEDLAHALGPENSKNLVARIQHRTKHFEDNKILDAVTGKPATGSIFRGLDDSGAEIFTKPMAGDVINGPHGLVEDAYELAVLNARADGRKWPTNAEIAGFIDIISRQGKDVIDGLGLPAQRILEGGNVPAGQQAVTKGGAGAFSEPPFGMTRPTMRYPEDQLIGTAGPLPFKKWPDELKQKITKAGYNLNDPADMDEIHSLLASVTRTEGESYTRNKTLKGIFGKGEPTGPEVEYGHPDYPTRAGGIPAGTKMTYGQRVEIDDVADFLEQTIRDADEQDLDWYRFFSRDIGQIIGPQNKPEFAGTFAILSPQSPVETNLRDAIETMIWFREYKASKAGGVIEKADFVNAYRRAFRMSDAEKRVFEKTGKIPEGYRGVRSAPLANRELEEGRKTGRAFWGPENAPLTNEQVRQGQGVRLQNAKGPDKVIEKLADFYIDGVMRGDLKTRTFAMSVLETEELGSINPTVMDVMIAQFFDSGDAFAGEELSKLGFVNYKSAQGYRVAQAHFNMAAVELSDRLSKEMGTEITPSQVQAIAWAVIKRGEAPQSGFAGLVAYPPRDPSVLGAGIRAPSLRPGMGEGTEPIIPGTLESARAFSKLAIEDFQNRGFTQGKGMIDLDVEGLMKIEQPLGGFPIEEAVRNPQYRGMGVQNVFKQLSGGVPDYLIPAPERQAITKGIPKDLQ